MNNGEKQVQVLEAVCGGGKAVRAAAYCRVSTNLPSQESSIENQRMHYQKLICANPDWVFSGIYWETGVSATKAETRPELQRLLTECRAGRVDMIVTKSISRFSRSTADCLKMVRELNALGVAIWFEKENLRTDRMESELLLTILAAFSQEESRSISENMKWGIRKRFRAGTFRGAKAPYGYRKTPNGLPAHAVEPAQADVVRGIFRAVANGVGPTALARELNAAGIPTWSALNAGRDVGWSCGRIRQIVKNRFYIGEEVWQKTYMDEQYRQRVNRGELDRYVVEDAHPAIIDPETFERANAVIEQNRISYGGEKAGRKRRNRYCFSGRIVCGTCGGKMYRGGRWPCYLCENHLRRGTCPMSGVSEQELKAAFLAVRGGGAEFTEADAEAFSALVERATVWRGERIEFRLRDGTCLTAPLCRKKRDERRENDGSQGHPGERGAGRGRAEA